MTHPTPSIAPSGATGILRRRRNSWSEESRSMWIFPPRNSCHPSRGSGRIGNAFIPGAYAAGLIPAALAGLDARIGLLSALSRRQISVDQLRAFSSYPDYRIEARHLSR